MVNTTVDMASTDPARYQWISMPFRLCDSVYENVGHESVGTDPGPLHQHGHWKHGVTPDYSSVFVAATTSSKYDEHHAVVTAMALSVDGIHRIERR